LWYYISVLELVYGVKTIYKGAEGFKIVFVVCDQNYQKSLRSIFGCNCLFNNLFGKLFSKKQLKKIYPPKVSKLCSKKNPMRHYYAYNIYKFLFAPKILNWITIMQLDKCDRLIGRNIKLTFIIFHSTVHL
jgi:hypothetical protein